jgi:hypothetical protein
MTNSGDRDDVPIILAHSGASGRRESAPATLIVSGIPIADVSH